ncbi:MAG: hypothetical protein HY200_02165 [Nitrospirae bacterium]|nr:hypothetical protein [Nitrospirota bacterium]
MIIVTNFALILFLKIVFIQAVFAYEVIPVDHGGELFGTVRIKGDAPPNEVFRVINTPEFCGKVVESETFLVHPVNKGIKNVVVSVENISHGKKPVFSTIVIANRHCHFVPHVQTGIVGSPFEISNGDPVLHNTHFRIEDETLINVAMPARGRKISRLFSKSGIVSIKCDAHKFMQSWMFVSDNPYSVVTNEEGNYKISDIPPGKYKIKIWHERFPVQIKEIMILPEKRTELSVELYQE